MSRLMGAMSIERSETSVEAYSSDLPVADIFEIYWTMDSMLCVWCFNGNINYSQCFRICTRSSLTSELYMELTFDSCSIADLWETIIYPLKYLGFMVSESKTFLHLVVLTLNLWTSHIPMFNYVSSVSVTPSHHQGKVVAVVGVPNIESGRSSAIHRK